MLRATIICNGCPQHLIQHLIQAGGGVGRWLHAIEIGSKQRPLEAKLLVGLISLQLLVYEV